MTAPREWPNNQRIYRDRAAEETAAAERYLRKLLARVQAGQYTRHGLEIDLLTSCNHLLAALRHLEKAGAQTEPE
jgi:hypothetical protein